MNYYDNYTFLQKYSAELGSLVTDFQVKENCALGLQTGKVQKASGGGKVFDYSANGAMKRFQRRGRKDDGEYGKIDNLHIKLNGNQLLSVVDDALPANKYSSFNFIDGANETVEYEYNGVGALTKDLNRGMTIRYDNLDYPRHIKFNDGNSTTYSYLPDGTLLSREYGLKYIGRKGESNGAIGIASGTDGETTGVPSLSNSQIAERPSLIVFGKTEYSGNVIYKNGKLDKVLFPGGYCTFDSENNSQPIFHYFTQDHLGNNRTVTNEDGTVEQITHYYPFGGTFNDAGLNASLQQYKYNGKELDRVAGLNTYDYGARQYFSALPTWDRMDALCEKYYNVSPYVYCNNNPILCQDYEGLLVIISGSLSTMTLKQLQAIAGNSITLFIKDGFLGYKSNAISKVNSSARKIIEIISNNKITVNLITTDKLFTSTGNLFVGGAFMGNEVTLDENGNVKSVDAYQEINPIVLGKADKCSKEGTFIMHELTEAFEGAKISENKRKSSPPSFKSGSVFKEAHKEASRQPAVYERLKNNDDVVKDKSEANSVEWFVGSPNYVELQEIIQKYP